jgi:glucokinase
MKSIRIGLDIGGTKIAALATTPQKKIVAQTVSATKTTSPDAFISSLQDTIAALLVQAQTDTNGIEAIGVGIPGQINQKTGTIHQAVNLNLDNYPLQEALQQHYNCPVYIENDVAAAALGAYHYLLQNDDTLQHIVYMGIGTGIAAGLIINEQLYRGAHGMAGEIGHVIVEPGGTVCKCGANGCLETVVSGPALARQAAHFLPAPVTAYDVVAAAEKNDPQAQALLQRVGVYLAQAIQWLMMAYDVEKIVLGGGVTNAGPAFLDPILQSLAHIRNQSPLAETMLSDSKVIFLPPGYNAGLWGASYLAEQALAISYPNLNEEIRL